MSYSLHDYVNRKGENEFKEWTASLQKVQRAKLNERLDKLALHGEELVPGVLTDTHVAGIRKLRVRGNVQLRPLLCNGPVSVGKEYTLLMGATEKDDEWQPKKAPEAAVAIKNEVKKDPKTRRKNHERVA